jgi:hypothetical protein
MIAALEVDEQRPSSGLEECGNPKHVPGNGARKRAKSWQRALLPLLSMAEFACVWRLETLTGRPGVSDPSYLSP